ncbi:hypothetical protein [Paludifilum halophilum]|uniref:Serine/threonine protein kinase n=1 Tax=Paludifilum halophilum TaxID=1642702 RepID=A0A235B9R6_9BACL|nr:hypothetical protein [Paludifilum halophilum]OYD09034.1 hypothetical protein CHM34_04480 [Paludifilum halophilum]
MFWNPIKPLLKQIEIRSNPGNEPVTVDWIPEALEQVGTGTDAVVVRHPSYPDIVFKVYADGREEARKNEFEVYRRLGESPYFPVCHGMDEGFLVLSHEPGVTLYECIVQGIRIPAKVVDEVEEARNYVRSVGLNPRDIHLKNVLLQEGHAKLLDVSEYLKPGDDGRWDHLVQAFESFYPLIEGKKIPVWLIELVKKTYYDQVNGDFSIAEFGRQFIQLLVRGKR